MAELRNPDAQDQLRRVLHLQSGVDTIPAKVSDIIQLTAEINPRLTRPATLLYGDDKTAIATLFTCNATNTTRITGMSLQADASVTNAATSMFITATIDGKTSARLAQISFNATTAEKGQPVNLTFTPPIAVDKSSPIKLEQNAAFVGHVTVCIYGYIETAQ